MSRKTRSHTVIKPRAPVCSSAAMFCDAPQAFVAEKTPRCRKPRRLLVLPDDAAFGAFQHQEQVVHVQRMADHAHRQSPDEFWLEAVFDEIPRLRLSSTSSGRHGCFAPATAKPIVASRSRCAHFFLQPPNAPLTMNKMCFVLMTAAIFCRAGSCPSSPGSGRRCPAVNAPALRSPPSA